MGNKHRTFDTRETHGQVMVGVKMPTLRYLNAFVRLRCAPDLLHWDVFPNAKEITESFAGLQAASQVMGKNSRSASHLCIVVGDGSTPRTGALIACCTNWNVVSIDPRMRVEKNWPIRRLSLARTTIEEWIPTNRSTQRPIVVAVHSHAKLAFVGTMIPPPLAVVAIPCCVPHTLDGWNREEYTDWGIHSPERDVIIFTPVVR